MDKPYYAFTSSKGLEKYKNKLEQELKHIDHILKHKEYVPDIAIYLDKIGTEIHFYDLDSVICRDFGGDDSPYFRLLMWFLADHKWKEALDILVGHFINGESEEKGK